MGKCGDNHQNNENPTKVQRKPIKVKYISSPMMIKARNAVEFRAIVQQLTGIDSGDSVRSRRSLKLGAAGGNWSSSPSFSMLHVDEMEVAKFSNDMSASLFDFDEGCFGNFVGFQSPCLFP